METMVAEHSSGEQRESRQPGSTAGDAIAGVMPYALKTARNKPAIAFVHKRKIKSILK